MRSTHSTDMKADGRPTLNVRLRGSDHSSQQQGMTADDFREEFDSEHPEKMGAYLQLHPDEIAAVLRGD